MVELALKSEYLGHVEVMFVHFVDGLCVSFVVRSLVQIEVVLASFMSKRKTRRILGGFL